IKCWSTTEGSRSVEPHTLPSTFYDLRYYCLEINLMRETIVTHAASQCSSTASASCCSWNRRDFWKMGGSDNEGVKNRNSQRAGSRRGGICLQTTGGGRGTMGSEPHARRMEKARRISNGKLDCFVESVGEGEWLIGQSVNAVQMVVQDHAVILGLGFYQPSRHLIRISSHSIPDSVPASTFLACSDFRGLYSDEIVGVVNEVNRKMMERTVDGVRLTRELWRSVVFREPRSPRYLVERLREM
ncbi:hypothetical protein BD779DRAFT_1716419, partial [Infundibulicybe gibba]